MQFWGGPKKEHHTPQAPLTNCPAARPRPPRPARPSASRPSPLRAPRVLPEGRLHSPLASPGLEERDADAARPTRTLDLPSTGFHRQRTAQNLCGRAGQLRGHEAGRRACHPAFECLDQPPGLPLPAASTASPGHAPPTRPGRSRASGRPFPLCPGRPARFPHHRGSLLRREPSHITRQPETQWIPLVR